MEAESVLDGLQAKKQARHKLNYIAGNTQHVLKGIGFFFFFSWNIIALHCCVSFCCIIMWNSLRGSVAFIAQLRLTLCDPMDCSEPGSSHTWPLPLEPPSRPPFHSSRLSQSAWLSSPCYVNAILSIRPTLFSPSLCPHIYSLSLCLCSWPANRLISTLFFFFSRFHVVVLF